MNISKIEPEKKDMDRARNLAWRGRTFYGNGAPFASKAISMSKLIKDKAKLVRRAKAVAAVWGTTTYIGYSAGKPVEENVWDPFAKALEDMGFTYSEITEISKYDNDEDVAASLGLDF